MLRLVDLRAGGTAPEPVEPALDADVREAAHRIIGRVREQGDRALVELTQQLDGSDIEGRIRVDSQEIVEAEPPPGLKAAIDSMAERLRGLHDRQLPRAWEVERDGVRFGEVVLPLASVGCYVPGGRAAYPSTVLMTALPARVAGVERVALSSPPAEDGSLPDSVLYAARVAEVDDVYRVGGAQAVAAMAYGTETVAAVDKIVGPGNAYVTAAKQEVSAAVGIDLLAGPTELVIVAGAPADPVVLAVDLVAQAEHDPQARTTLVCLDETLPEKVERALESEVESSTRRDIVQRALAASAAVIVGGEEEAAQVVEHLAPEHLQIVTTDPGAFLARVRSFGAAFLGPSTPISFGDYGVGSNHVLPTMSTARFTSGLRASDFVTVRSFVEASADAVARIGPEIEEVARAEELPGHARSSEVRR
ncbi:MAG: histidinol dehydrogenase [Actinomycetota bacterium]